MAGWFERAFPNPAFAGVARSAVFAGYGREHGRSGAGGLYGLRKHPTCVGKTMCFTLSRTSARKHPHVCGEDFPASIARRTTKETPPRVWGRRGDAEPVEPVARNTPTCVGKTLNDH